MRINRLGGNIFYIQDAFPQAKKFIEEIEKHDSDERTYSVFPKWEEWRDSIPKKIDSDTTDTSWEKIVDPYIKGYQKLFDWDMSIQTGEWPRKELEHIDEVHEICGKTIDLLHNDYIKILDFWAEETGNKKLQYISRNYFLRKYNKQGMISSHIDKNINNPLNTMDWSVLFYLNDDYEGGEIEFNDLNITIKPTAGSAIIFPCTTVHTAQPPNNNKYYIFNVIHSEFGYASGLGEPYHHLDVSILKYNNVENHILLDIEKEKLKRLAFWGILKK